MNKYTRKQIIEAVLAVPENADRPIRAKKIVDALMALSDEEIEAVIEVNKRTLSFAKISPDGSPKRPI